MSRLACHQVQPFAGGTSLMASPLSLERAMFNSRTGRKCRESARLSWLATSVIRVCSRSLAMCVVAVLVADDPLPAQSKHAGQSGPRQLLPRHQEVALARSAASPAVSKDATVWVLTDTAYVVAERGTSGVACYVARGWIESIEPHCFDAEGAATIMRMEMRRIELRHLGHSANEVEREIAAGLGSGRDRK